MTLLLTGAGPSATGVAFSITSILPTSIAQGATGNIVITGKGFKAGDSSAFGTGVTVNSTTVDSATQLTVNVAVAASATVGTRTLVVTQGSKTASKADCLTIAYGYLLLDQFTTSDDAPVSSPRTCEPGPGTLTFVQTDGTQAIASGKLAFTEQISANWGDQGFYGDAITRAAGRCLLADTTFSATANGQRGSIHWANSQAATYSNVMDNAFLQAGDGTYIDIGGMVGSGGGPTVWFDQSAPLTMQLCLSLRASGGFVLAKGGTLTDWTLLYVGRTHNTATVYPVFANYSATGSIDNLRIPTQLFTPTPLVSDNFTRGDSDTVGNSAGGGGEESGGTGIASTEVAGDWDISSNALVTAGSDPGASTWICTWAAGVANVQVQCQVTLQANSIGGIVLGSDGTDWYRVAIDEANNVIRIHEYNGVDTYTQRGSTSVTINASTAYQVQAMRHGAVIAGWVSNANTVSYSSASVNTTATNHGLASSTSGDAFDNLEIWARTQSVPAF